MNKKIIAMAVAAAVAAPLVAQAEVSFNGDARYRYGEVNDQTGAKVATGSTGTDNRVRLVATAKMEGGVEATTRLISDTAGVTADYAYITVPVAGVATLKAGDQLANWGLGFAIKDDAKAQRLNVVVPVGGFNILANYDPVVGTAGASSYGVTGKVGGGNVGLLMFGADGKGMDLFYQGKAGPVGLGFEYNSNDTGATKPVGMVLMGQYPMGSMNLNFGYASATDGFTAHKKFVPVSTIGLDQKTGIMNFGATAGNDSNAMLVGVDLKVGPGKLGAMVGSGSFDGTGATIMDVKYNVGVVGFTYGSVSMDGGTSYTAMGSEINVKF